MNMTGVNISISDIVNMSGTKEYEHWNFICTECCKTSIVFVRENKMRVCMTIQNLFLTAQSTQIKSVISVPIKDFIYHYPRALFNDITRVGAYFYNIPAPGRSLTTGFLK